MDIGQVACDNGMEMLSYVLPHFWWGEWLQHAHQMSSDSQSIGSPVRHLWISSSFNWTDSFFVMSSLEKETPFVHSCKRSLWTVVASNVPYTRITNLSLFAKEQLEVAIILVLSLISPLDTLPFVKLVEFNGNLFEPLVSIINTSIRMCNNLTL